ncbi:MAG: aryl-sulfate sulfotransferase [Brevinema sp.]
MILRYYSLFLSIIFFCVINPSWTEELVIQEATPKGSDLSQSKNTNSVVGEIVFNPTGHTPLSAIYKMPRVYNKSITVFIRGNVPTMTISYTFPEGYGNILPLHGFYSDQVNTVVIKPKDEEQTVYKIKVPPISIVSKGAPIPGIEPAPGTPINIRTRTLVDVLPSPQIQNQDLYFISMPNARTVIGLDRRGEIRYLYQPKSGSPHLVRMKKEGLEMFMYIIDVNKSLQKVNMMGRTIYTYPMNIHHDFIPYTDGRMLILANSKWGWEDAVNVIDSKGKILKTLYIGDAIRNAVSLEDQSLLKNLIFDDKTPYNINGKPKKIDWAHANSLVYDSDKDLLYLSLRHQGVLAINMSTWTMEWFLVSDNINIEKGLKYGNVPKEMIYLKDIPSLASKRMNATLADGNPIGQHSLFLNSNDTLLLFDNQADQKENPFGSRMMEYVLNHNAMRAQVISRYQPEDKNYSRYVSDVDITGDSFQNRLIFFGYGKIRRIIETDIRSATLFDMIIDAPSVMYRIDKFPLYPYREVRRQYSLDYWYKEDQKEYNTD